jgi:hypothetical protein
MEQIEILKAFEKRDAEIASRLLELEQKAVRPVIGMENASSINTNLEPVMQALSSSGNLTAKSVVPMNRKSILLQGVSSGHLYPTHESLGVVAQSSGLSLSSQLHTFAITGSNVSYSRISSTDSGAMQGGEGNLKKELSINAEPVLAESNTFAGWSKISTQALSDQQNIELALSQVMSNCIYKALDAHAFDVASKQGTVGTAGPTPLITALSAVGAINGYGKQGVVFVNPSDYLAMTLATTTNGEFIEIPEAFAGSIKMASGIPTGSYLATTLDGEGLDLAIRENLNIDVGVTGDDFVKNLRVLLAEIRGLAIVRDPSLVITGTLAANKTK